MRKILKNELNFISDIPDFFPKYTILSSDFTKLRSFGLLLRKEKWINMP